MEACPGKNWIRICSLLQILLSLLLLWSLGTMVYVVHSANQIGILEAIQTFFDTTGQSFWSRLYVGIVLFRPILGLIMGLLGIFGNDRTSFALPCLLVGAVVTAAELVSLVGNLSQNALSVWHVAETAIPAFYTVGAFRNLTGHSQNTAPRLHRK